VSLLCICIVFIPMFFLQGIPRFLFVPMAEAVIFAMIWSFILSRTLVPTMAMYLLKPHQHEHGAALPPTRNPLVWFQRGFESGFERFRAGYRDLLTLALHHRPTFVACFLAFVVASFAMVPYLGQNFFPTVDAGQILMHVRLQVGTRLEESANQFADIQKAIKKIIPPDGIETMTDNIGMPISGINMTYNNTGVMGSQDGDIQIKLKEDHPPTENYVKAMREQLPQLFPGTSFAFLPADIVNQILNFGAPAPIDLQVRGNNLNANFAYATNLLNQIRRIPGVADARIQQSTRNPTFNIDVDRTRAQYVGLTERDVVNSLTVNLAGSGQVAPTYFLNPDNGVNYAVVMQTPQYQLDSLSALQTLPITSSVPTQAPILGGVASISRTTSNAVVSQYDIQPMVQIFATPQGRDLGGIAADINKVIADTAKDVPKGSTVVLSGQVQTMNSSFSGLLFGLLGAIVLVYFLIVVNFQSWSDPFVIITALPAALAGIVWMLFTTHTTMSVPALTGAIMCMGVATANSVLVISFARERYDELGDPVAAAIEAGFVRIRPVLMTALAMIIGMLPMSLGLGEGGEANAPLGRAVIGGLMFSTVATLMFVPVVFSMLHKKQDAKAAVQSETVNAH
jgi:multidrug efflux pump subunit AcrB